MQSDYSPLFKKWYSDISAAPTDKWIMGRVTGTNRAVAVHRLNEEWQDCHGKPVDICQWISFTDFADIRSCVWRSF